MKNKFKAISTILLIVLSFILTGCDDFNISYSKINKEEDWEKIELIINNNTGWKIQFVDYGLHIKKDNLWISVIPQGMESGYMTAYTIKSGDSHTITHKTQELFGVLEPGEYMIKGKYRCYHFISGWTNFYELNYVFSK